MRVLVVYAHPLSTSFAASLCSTVADTLRAAGHSVDICDLYAEGFEPALSGEERHAYHQPADNTRQVESHVARLRAAEGLVLIFPSWWYGMPAILKGWFDRVWLPGVAFELGSGAIRPLLSRLRMFGVVTTTGAPAWFTRLYMGNPSRKVLMRGLSRLLPSRGVERIWLAFYGIDHSVESRRALFVEKVRRRFARVL